MSSLDYIKSNLLDSCRDLHIKGVINKDGYNKCDDSLKNTLELGNLNEIDIFGENRYNKNNNYVELIQNARKINNDYLINRDQLDIVLKNILEELNNLIVERYKDREDLQYNVLVDYYKKIDLNRTKLNTLNKETLELQKLIYDNKIIDSGYKLRLGFFILFIIVFLVLLIVYLKY